MHDTTRGADFDDVAMFMSIWADDAVLQARVQNSEIVGLQSSARSGGRTANANRKKNEQSTSSALEQQSNSDRNS